MLKSYFLIKESVPTGWAILSVAHASIKMLEHFREDPATQNWLECFRKVVVQVTDEQFEKSKQYSKDFISYVEDDYGKDELVLAFKPDHEWPGFFKSLPLYK